MDVQHCQAFTTAAACVLTPLWWDLCCADDPSVDLAAKAPGAFQGTNETLGCPEKDVYGSGYVCEWWAPVSARPLVGCTPLAPPG